MHKFDSIITLGDSWSWGSELPETQRIEKRFDSLLSKEFKVESINLARESATNFCYKWHWFDWVFSNPVYKNPIVIVGITGPNRHLIWNNSANFFQESPDRLVSEHTVLNNWGNNPNNGGFIRAFPNHVDFPDPIKKHCQENFYRYNYDDNMAEIYAIWEIKLLDLAIREHGGYPIFWSNFYPYQQMELAWPKSLLKNCNLVNNLQPFTYQSNHFYCKNSHPNELGHQHIATVLERFIHG
jgi:hypothetical protein